MTSKHYFQKQPYFRIMSKLNIFHIKQFVCLKKIEQNVDDNNFLNS